MSNSIRSAIRARFRGDREQSLGPGDCSDSSKNSSRECLHHNKDEQKLSAEAISILKDDEDEDHSVMIGVDGAHEKDVYELQLSQLQEQLVAAMIENQNLNNELDLFKGQNQVDQLLQELEEEKNNVKALQAAIDKVNSTDSKDVIPRGPSESDDMYSGWVDVAEEAEASETEEIGDLPASTASKNVTDRLTHSLMKVLLNFLSDFTDDPAPESIVTVEEEPLAVKKLKDNIKRFRHNTKPVFNTMKSLKHLFTWKNPSLTLIVFTIYMYSVWVGYLLPVLTFVILARLTINYLKERGWNINIVFLADIEDDEKDSEAFKDLGMSDKFNLVLQVAKQVQNTMGKLSDNLEKVKNLLTWKHPPATRRLFAALCIGFVLSCLMEGTLLFTLAALFFGIKMFVVQFLFVKFPRLKQRHDTTSKLWKELPTDAQLDKKYQKAATEVSSWYHHSTPTTSRRPSSTNSNTSHDLILKEHFNLPATETTIPGWQGGRRCTMIFKDKSLTSAFKNGRLYLTQSYLCFERVRSSSSKNVLIALSDITRVDKANPFVWMPGSGMSIEITLVNQEKPVLFGAMLYRDECYDSIMSQGANLLLSWATPSSPGGGGAGPSTPHATDRKSSEAAAVMSSSAATL